MNNPPLPPACVGKRRGLWAGARAQVRHNSPCGDKGSVVTSSAPSPCEASCCILVLHIAPLRMGKVVLAASPPSLREALCCTTSAVHCLLQMGKGESLSPP